MSERGSFCTEYMYCRKCYDAVLKVFLEHQERGKFLWADTISNWGDTPDIPLPIIAGKIGESYTNGELVFFEHYIMPEIEKVICHSIRIAVLCDAGANKIFTIVPQSSNNTEDGK